MFPFDTKRNPRLKRGFQEVFFDSLESPPQKGDCRAQNGDFVWGVVSKRPKTGRISERGFSRFDKRAPRNTVIFFFFWLFIHP